MLALCGWGSPVTLRFTCWVYLLLSEGTLKETCCCSSAKALLDCKATGKDSSVAVVRTSAVLRIMMDSLPYRLCLRRMLIAHLKMGANSHPGCQGIPTE